MNDDDLQNLPHGSPSRGPRRRAPNTNARRFGKYLAIFVVILGIIGAGTVIGVYKYVDNKIQDSGDATIKTDENVPPADPLKETTNILVLGSDRRDVVEGGEAKLRQFKGSEADGQRSDTMMVIQLREGGKRAVGLSFPRDLLVEIPGRRNRNRINTSYSGGPNMVMDTIRNLTGLQIHHYVEINYSSFRRIVDAVGGVRLCVNKAYRDAQSGLYVDKPGCYQFDGNKALSFVRMRKADPEGDFGRIKRQQLFMRELMKKVKSAGFLLDIPRVVRTANAVSAGIKTDTGLSLGLIRTIASKLAGYSQANIDFRTVPSEPTLIGGTSYVAMHEEQAESLFQAMVNGDELPPFGKTSQSLPELADLHVDVKNASGITGAGRAWAERLEESDVRVREIENADTVRNRTQIAYQPGADLKAKLLADTFFPGAELVQSVNIGTVVDAVVLVGRTDAAKVVSSASPSPSSG